eukprot:4364460-Alexandrium_andersonii.AAC.2
MDEAIGIEGPPGRSGVELSFPSRTGPEVVVAKPLLQSPTGRAEVAEGIGIVVPKLEDKGEVVEVPLQRVEHSEEALGEGGPSNHGLCASLGPRGPIDLQARPHPEVEVVEGPQKDSPDGLVCRRCNRILCRGGQGLSEDAEHVLLHTQGRALRPDGLDGEGFERFRSRLPHLKDWHSIAMQGQRDRRLGPPWPLGDWVVHDAGVAPANEFHPEGLSLFRGVVVA